MVLYFPMVIYQWWFTSELGSRGMLENCYTSYITTKRTPPYATPRNFRPKQAQLRDHWWWIVSNKKGPRRFFLGGSVASKGGKPLGYPTPLASKFVGEIQWSCQKNPRWELHSGRKASKKNWVLLRVLLMVWINRKFMIFFPPVFVRIKQCNILTWLFELTFLGLRDAGC